MSRTTGSKAGKTSHYADVVDVTTYMSSSHVWNTLTHLLYITLKPLVISTTIIEDIAQSSLAASMDRRRKIGAKSTESTVDILYKSQFQPPLEMLRNVLRDLGIERTIISVFIEEYISGSYVPARRRGNLEEYWENEPLLEYTKDMYALYCDFRNKVTQRFQKLSNSAADKNKWGKDQQGLHSDVGDHRHNFFLAVVRAVDKFYPNKGTLASYVITWLKNAAGSQFTLYQGEAFGLSRSVRHSIHLGDMDLNNKSFDIDTAIDIPTEQLSAAEVMDERTYVEYVANVQKEPKASMAFLFNNSPLIITREILHEIGTLSQEKKIVLPDNWKPLEHVIDDLVPLNMPVRSPRSRKENK